MEPQAARGGGHDGRLAVREPAPQSGVDDLARRDGRGRGRALQDRQGRAGRVRGREPAARRAGALGLRVHRRARSGAPRRWLELRKGRVPAARHDARVGREAQARVQAGRDGDGGELERHQRRGGGAARQGRQCRHGAAGAHCRNRGGGRGSRLHGPGSHSGDPEGAQAGRAQHRPDRSRRAERGVRRAGDRLRARAQARPYEGEYLRRGDRAGSSPRRHGRPDSDDSRTRLTPVELSLRSLYDVHRRGPGDRHGGGAGVMAAYDRVLVDIAEGIGTLTLARPEKLNAFDREMCRDLIDALRMLSGSEQVRVILLTGAGRGFCAGADLGTLAEGAAELVGAGREVPVLIRTAPQPVLAAVNGPAAGGGANLALACDYRIASDQASIGQVFHKLGLVPDWGGSFFLPRLVGPAKALELVWSARMVPAAEALALGLFDRVVPQERLQAEARALARLWASQPPLAGRRAKEALYVSEQSTLASMLELELAQQMELFATPEAQRRIGASRAQRSH